MNVALSALVAGVTALLDGRSFWRPAAAGGLGGLISFGGKKMIASSSGGVAFLGREVSAVGASVTRNAIVGVGVLDSLTLPVGPLRLHLGRTEGLSAGLRVDLNSLVWATYGLASDRYTLDRGGSLRTGVFVFRTDALIDTEGEVLTIGRAGAGAVFLANPYRCALPRCPVHELTHVAQTDYLQIAFGGPAEHGLLRRLGVEDSGIFRFIEPGIAYYPLIPPLRPLMEREARSFERR